MKVIDREVQRLVVVSRAALSLTEIEAQIFRMNKHQLREVIYRTALGNPVTVALAWGWQVHRPEDE